MESQPFTLGRSIVQTSQLFKDSKLIANFNSTNKPASENPDNYVYIDKETWNDIELKIKLMIDDLDALNNTNKKLEESLENARSERNKLIFNYETQMKTLKVNYEAKLDTTVKNSVHTKNMNELIAENQKLVAEIKDLRNQNDDLLKLNEILENNSERDRKAWYVYQKLTESKFNSTLSSLVKEKEFLKNKMQSEKQIITDNVKTAYKTERKINSSKMMVFETQNEFLETELTYYKKKVNDLENDKKFMESKIENYQKQLKVIIECVTNLEQKFGMKESKLITDSQFETLKHSINFQL